MLILLSRKENSEKMTCKVGIFYLEPERIGLVIQVGKVYQTPSRQNLDIAVQRITAVKYAQL